MKISFITTVFNEEATIKKFLTSLFSQTKLPDEIIIVDGGSSDNTIETIKKQESEIKRKRITFKVLVKKGNRSIGRNEAIKNATGEIIVCSDAGNILDKKWIENITKPFKDKKVDVVSGYYKGQAKNIFQKCLIPYVLVMPDKVDQQNFLPATRSVAFKKSIWKKAKGFPEIYSHNEDYVFANRLRKIKAKIVFAKDALVYWIPRTTFKEAFIMFFRFALGDAESKMKRNKVLFLFVRYLLGFFLLLLSILYQSWFGFVMILLLLLAYIAWAVAKNYRYSKDVKAFYILPLLQFTADAAVISGTIIGTLKRLQIAKHLQRNLFLVFLLLFYISFVLVTLPWGLPNPFHPFPYNMDEWHQLMAVKAVVKYGTTTVPGAAQIPFVFPVLSGLYLIPFVLFHIVDPFALKSPLLNVLAQLRLFEILRSINIFFGTGSILLIAWIAKQYLKIDYRIPVFFFVISPIFLLLSTFFKYDIGLLFWLILSLASLLHFGEKPTVRNYIFASIICAAAMATKFSAIPLLPMLIFSAFLYVSKKNLAMRYIPIGLAFYVLAFIIFGIPNLLWGKADYGELLASNLIISTSNFILPYPWPLYILFNQLPILFGQLFYFLSIISLIYLSYQVVVKRKYKVDNYRNILFLISGFLLFLVSLIPLKIWATSNRPLVLLPFMVLISGFFFDHWYKNIHLSRRFLISVLFIITIILQLYQTGAWLYTKYKIDSQKESSLWIEKNIPKGTTIGIENIPIYQGIPNNVLKEFYANQYNLKEKNLFHYVIVDEKSSVLPPLVVLSNAEVEKEYFVESSKKSLLRRLEKEGYKQINVFHQDFTYLKTFVKSDLDFYFSGIASGPVITIYKK